MANEGASMELEYNELLFVEALAQVAEESGRPFEEALQAFAAKEPSIQAAVAAAYKFLVTELAKFRQEPKALKAPNSTTLASRFAEKQKQCKLNCAKQSKNKLKINQDKAGTVQGRIDRQEIRK